MNSVDAQMYEMIAEIEQGKEPIERNVYPINPKKKSDNHKKRLFVLVNAHSLDIEVFTSKKHLHKRINEILTYRVLVYKRFCSKLSVINHAYNIAEFGSHAGIITQSRKSDFIVKMVYANEHAFTLK